MKNFTLNKTLLIILAVFSLANSYNVLAQTETTLGFYDFESGTQGWTQSTQAYRATNTFYAYDGNTSFWLRDNLGNNSSMTSPSFYVGAYDKIDFKFFFTTYSMENGEDFFVEYKAGNIIGSGSWQTVARFVSGSVANKNGDFQSGNSTIFYSKTVTLMATDFNFPTIGSGTFRIRCDASDTNDYVMIDNITITGTTFNNPTTGPGGVVSNLDLWLKADQLDGSNYGLDGANVSKWVDNGKGNNAEVVVAGQEPVYRDNASKNMNFNPVIEFENNNNTSQADMTYLTNRDELKGTGGFSTNDVFVVLMPDPEITTSMIPLDTFTGSDPLTDSFTEDVTGFGYGSYTARVTNERLSFCIGTTSETPSNPTENGYGIADTNSGTDYNQIQIINVRQNNANNNMELYFNANQVGNETNDLSRYATINNGRYWLGRSQYWNGSFDGRIAEVITYNSRKSDNNLTQERNRIQSYLGIKYGITLGVNGISQDYVDSQGNVIWDQSANIGYNYDIAGIGRDDSAELDQRQSRSINSELDATGETRGLITIGLTDIYDTNSLNKASNPVSLNNREYLTWGNNNADLNAAPEVISVDMSSGIPGLSTLVSFLGMQRIWKVVENGGDIGKVKVSIPQNAIRNITPPGSYYMFISDTPVFDPTADYRLMTLNGTNLETSYDFDGTKYITFGYASQVEVTRSVYFNGANSYMDMDNNLDLNPSAFTVSAWIKREASDTGTKSIVSKRNSAFNEGYDLQILNNNRIRMEWQNGSRQRLTSNTSIPDNEWHHIAVIYNGSNEKIYIDGVLDKSANRSAPTNTDESFLVAAASKTSPTQFFRGNIDEIRVWDTNLSESQLRYIMNQEIEDNGSFTSGKIVPNTITNNEVAALPWSNLKGYYPMSIYTYTNTNDASGSNIQGALKNLNTVDFQTAPLPYTTSASGDWENNSTWTNGNTFYIPGSTSIVDADVTVDWNIVEISHDVTLDNSNLPAINNDNRTVLSLNVINNTLSVNGDNNLNTGYGLTVSHYLKVDGKIDLQGESQLIQSLNSDLDPSSTGTIERDQQGTKDLFTYNFWSSPVGVTNNSTNNNAYTLPQVFKDGTDPNNPVDINFITNSYNGTSGSPIGIADYWIWKYSNQSGAYADWQHVRSTGSLLTGEGFTLKGVTNTGNDLSQEQNYVFVGKPNNGDINLPITAGNEYLVGNPYASALDAHQFIMDNAPTIEGAGSTTGTLYFWEHWGGGSHNLADYQGGYATYNLSGSTPAASYGTNDPLVATGGTPVKLPGRYIPVSQGFFVKSENTGTIRFNNGQRIFEKEGVSSVFVRSTADAATTANSYNADTRLKIRLGFNSVNTVHRQLLVTQDSNATSSYDWGYDGEAKTEQMDDMYWMISDNKYTIQGTDVIDHSTILPLGLHVDNDGINTITIDALENVPDDLDIYIYDNVTNIYHDLRQGDATLDLTTGAYLDRFDLRFSQVSSLLSTEDFEIETTINYYYANSSNTIVINNPKLENVKTVSLYNVLGQEIISFDEFESSDLIELKTNKISTGTYILEIKTNDGKLSKKVLIE
ncbi:LamG-like jellyroll fold domain-containing protein [Olleya marilimosa]|uniref:LamG-like jellyroll fold domain-containing protein n=1 Tax=Olleya marilimosa TaxID=272164 RepID=UPI0030EE3966|tara:strand:+ start:8570 stop:13222 length:4653 start_codon:yes stop_codon:yes gene_type:complete